MSQLDPFSDPGYRRNAFQNRKLDAQVVERCQASWEHTVGSEHPLAELVEPLKAIGCSGYFLFDSDQRRLLLRTPAAPEKGLMSIEILPDGYRECRLALEGSKSRSIVSDYPDRDPAVMEFLDRLAAFEPK